MTEIKVSKTSQEEIINNTIKEIKQDLKNGGLDEFSEMTTNFIKIYAKGIEKEREKTDYWKRKAYILFQYNNIGRLECPEHDTHVERTFDIWQMIKDKECKNCEWKKRK